MSNVYYLIDKAIVPKVYEKVVECNELIQENNCSISQACNKVGISRAAYYKYKDAVFLQQSSTKDIKAVVSMTVKQEKGNLIPILTVLNDCGCKILTINQNMPVKGKANLIISFDLDEGALSINDVIDALKELNTLSAIKLMSIE